MSRAIFRIGFVLVVSCFLYWNHASSFAQEKSTRVDTTKEADQKLLPSIEPAQLQLPDVLIYGSDRSLRISGDKLAQPWDDAKAIAPKISYRPVADELELVNKSRHLLDQAKPPKSRTLGQLDVGRFEKFNIAAGHWQRINDYYFGFHGFYNRSSGQYKNSQFSQGALQGLFSFPAVPQINLSSQLDFHWANYGLYGSPIKHLHRRKRGGDLKLDSQWIIDTEQSANFGLLYQQTNFFDSDGNDFRQKGVLRHVGLNVVYQTNYWNIPIQWRAGYEYQALGRIDSDSTNAKNYLYLGASSSFVIKSYITIQPSILFENLDVNDSLSAYQLWPSIELITTPVKQLGLKLRLSKELSPCNYVELIEKNPFLSLKTIFVPIRNELELRLSGEYMPSSHFSLSFEFIRQTWRSFGYWVRETELGLLELGEIDKVQLSTVKLLTRYRLSPRANLETALQWQFDQIQRDSMNLQGDRVPYLERFRLPINFDYQIDRATQTSLSMIVVGPRYADRNNMKRLDGFVLISARGSRQLMKNIAAYAEINNLLNQKYQLWEKYPALGFYFEIGLKGNW